MSSRTLPAHGTYARANGSPGYREGCNCAKCRPVRLAAKKRNQVNARLGRRARVDATRARAHLQKIRPTMGWPSLAARTDCDWHTLNMILTGERKEISHITERKILAVQPASEPDPGMYINAAGTVRRIRAMQVVGHSYRAIAEAAETSDARIQKVACGTQPTVRYMLAKKIEAAYQALAYNPPPNGRERTKTINCATAKGWYGPDVWDDTDRIDDPDFDPAPLLKETPRFMRLGEDALWLEEQGYTRKQVAYRLGESVDYVSQSIKRYREALATIEAVAA